MDRHPRAGRDARPRQFFWADLKCLHEKRRVRIFEEMEKALRDELWDGTQWVADYRRIRVIASK